MTLSLRKLYLVAISSIFLISIGITACREVVAPWDASEAGVPDSIAGDYLSARFAQKQNDNKNAARFVVSAIDKDPGNIDLMRKGYEIMLLAGKIDESIVLAKRYLANGGKTMGARLLVSLGEIKKQKYDSAFKILEEADKDGASDASTTGELVVPVFRAWIAAGQGNFDKAFVELNKKKLIGLESFIKYQMALLHDIAGNSKEAKELYDDLMKSGPKSLRLTEVSVNFYVRNGQKEKAEKIISKFVVDNPGLEAENFLHQKNPVIQNALQGVSELLLEVASFLYSNRLDEMAQGYTYMSLYLTDDFPHAKLLLSKLLKEQERYKEAIDVLETISYPPYFHWQARLQIARLYYKIEDNEKAEKLLISMSKQDPDDKDALLTLGDVLMDDEEYERAIVVYSQALDRNKEETEQDWVIYYARGIAYERADDWDNAEKDFFRALELMPDQPDALNYLGYTWLIMNKNIEEAEQMLLDAITQRPNDAHIMDSYGWALYKMGQYEQAVYYLEKANLLLPHDATTNDHLGDVYWKLGRTNEAYFQWKRALLYDPEEEERVKIEDKIANGLDVVPFAAAEDQEELLESE